MIGTWISAREQGENPTVNHSCRQEFAKVSKLPLGDGGQRARMLARFANDCTDDLYCPIAPLGWRTKYLLLVHYLGGSNEDLLIDKDSSLGSLI